MRSFSLTVLLLASTSIATAAPKRVPPKPAPTTFAKVTTFQSCSTSTVFMCGMRDAGGHTYGTAREMQHCTSYTFLPNGTFTVTGMGTSSGRYRLHDGIVTLTEDRTDPADPVPAPYDLEVAKLTPRSGTAGE